MAYTSYETTLKVAQQIIEQARQQMGSYNGIATNTGLNHNVFVACAKREQIPNFRYILTCIKIIGLDKFKEIFETMEDETVETWLKEKERNIEVSNKRFASINKSFSLAK